MRRLFRTLLAGGVVIVLALVTATPGQTWSDNPTEGCTPGFWKNHTEDWVDFTPDQTLGSVFTGVDPSLADKTLLEALDFMGGTTLVEKQANMLRAAVAAVLNASSDIDYGVRPQPVIKATNKRLAKNTAGAYENFKDLLDARNNLGCPL